jgi:hypothetical protein
MIIANPLFDTAFKGLARDPEVAKAIIETLLETEVVDIHLEPTEYNKPMGEDDKFPKYLRVDYLAVITTKGGSPHQVLIEVQKASGADDLMRLRYYLATAGYRPKPGEKKNDLLPIVTIYFLGFPLKNVDTPCLKVSRQYVDMIKNEVLETKEQFVELLTHDSYVIQIPRINIGGAPRTKLERILSVFERSDSPAQTIDYTYPIEEAFQKKMVDILLYISADPEERKKMENEAYWNRYDDCTAGELIRMQDKLVQKDGEIAQKNGEIAQQAGVIAGQAEEIEKLKKLIENIRGDN